MIQILEIFRTLSKLIKVESLLTIKANLLRRITQTSTQTSIQEQILSDFQISYLILNISLTVTDESNQFLSSLNMNNIFSGVVVYCKKKL